MFVYLIDLLGYLRNKPADQASVLGESLRNFLRDTNTAKKCNSIYAHFQELHLIRVGGSRADMAEFVRAERQRWEDVIRSANVTLE